MRIEIIIISSIISISGYKALLLSNAAATVTTLSADTIYHNCMQQLIIIS